MSLFFRSKIFKQRYLPEGGGGRSVGEKSSRKTQAKFLTCWQLEMRLERFLDKAVKRRQRLLAGPKTSLETVSVLTKSLGLHELPEGFQSLHDQSGQRKRE